MRTARLLAGSALAMVALGISAPAAVAEGSEVSVSPEVGYPGSTITVSTSICASDATYAKGQSEAGGQINLVESGREGELEGNFTVPANAKEGTYAITVKCPPGVRVDTEFEVARRPSGAVSGGFGGADGLNGTEVAIGAALILTAAAGGLLTMRRRHGSEPAA
ncbi:MULTISPECIES: hypothetical protein [unclassified Streptomyces]|uniref:hypothetical protein n=1 Tax=Streptomyces sp. NPDC006678 TaxID=3157185 RepID=UPI0033C14C6D